MADGQPGPLQPWRVHGERTIYDNPWVKLVRVDVEPPGVERFEHHAIRLRRVAVAAVIDDSDRVLLLWRYRFLPRRWGWELPGGYVDHGEDAAKAAAREVEEETGYRPDWLTHLITFEPMIGMVNSAHEVFLGRGAARMGEPTDVEEAGRVAWIPLAEVPALIRRGDVVGSGTLVALLHILAFGVPDVPGATPTS